jgi:hypothetical protein
MYRGWMLFVEYVRMQLDLWVSSENTHLTSGTGSYEVQVVSRQSYSM